MHTSKLSALYYKCVYYAGLRARSILFTIYKIPFVIIILLLGFYAFCINDQGRDLMAAFGIENKLSGYFILFVLYLILWSWSVWNTSRILLRAANLKMLVEKEIDPATINVVLPENQLIAQYDEQYRKSVEFMIKWVPRTLAMLPYVIFIYGFSDENWLLITAKFWGSYAAWKVIIVTVIAIIHLRLYITRTGLYDRFLKRNVTPDKPNQGLYTWNEERTVWGAVKNARVVQSTTLLILAIITMFIISHSFAYSNEGLPGLIITSGLIFYTVIGLFLNLITLRTRIPVFSFAVLLALLICFPYNNNHRIQTLSGTTNIESLKERSKRSDTSYFRQWLQTRIDNGTYGSDTLNTIYLIASEGGGIRNCYWTFAVLNKLHQAKPDLYQKTFAVTGASGGSVGLGFYYSYLYHNYDRLNSTRFKLGRQDSTILDKISRDDYLSRVTYGFLYPDLLQRLLPWSIDSWDRGKMLENSFSDGYRRYAGEASELDSNYLAMWQGNGSTKHPAILFNSTYVEQGSKAIFSPYTLSGTYYPDALDVLSVTKMPVPMKEGMVSSARFPVITPPGLMITDAATSLGHLSDGGVFENTAIQTAQQTALMIKAVLNNPVFNKYRFKIAIAYIGYGENSIVNKEFKKTDSTLGRTYELAPFIGSYNALFRWINSVHGIITYLDKDLEVIEFGLPKPRKQEHSLPLGWYLSDVSRDKIREALTSDLIRKHIFHLQQQP